MKAVKRYLLRMCAIVAIYFVLGLSAYLVEEILDMPHPYYGPDTSWFQLALRRGYQRGVLFATAIFLIANLSVVIDCARTRDHRALRERFDMDYYPRFWRAPRWLRSWPSRLVIIAGFLVVAVYWTATMIWIWEADQSPHGAIYPPHRVSLVILFAWSVTWLADCFQRKHKTTIVGAILFMMLISFCLYSEGVYPLVE